MIIKTILLVEDDAEDQHLFMQALDTLNLGIQCKTVNNGEEAMDHLNNGPHYEIIFLDLNMPLMNGFDCLHLLNEKYKDIPIIVFTSSINPAALARCQSLGAKASFHKPNSFTALCLELHDILMSKN